MSNQVSETWELELQEIMIGYACDCYPSVKTLIAKTRLEAKIELAELLWKKMSPKMYSDKELMFDVMADIEDELHSVLSKKLSTLPQAEKGEK